jgi:hypothetical protein
MGIDIDSKLMLVCNQEKLYSVVEEHSEENCDGDFHEALDELGLSSASPYFDADRDCLYIGVELAPPTYEDLLDQESCWWGELNKAKDLLFKLTGEDSCKLDSFQNVW